MVLTDNELGMIEQLTYMDHRVAEQAGIQGFSGIKSGQKNMTLSEILSCFDEEALRNLEEKGNQKIGLSSAQEWAGMIRYLQESQMKDLVLKDTMAAVDGTTLAMCFVEEGSADDAIVAFRGTHGGDEWVDNVEGLNVTDTQCQKEALDFIESLPYENVTVTGHSKGGNKAMYVAITSDKVTRCVAYDGQGFSQEFIDKYWAEIQAKGEVITEYSLSTDYVHVLLFPVPNAKQVYCQGWGVDGIGEHHSPNSFFMADEKGKLILDESGNPIVVEIPEDESMQMLHKFTTFVLNNADDKDKVEIVDFSSQLLALMFSGDQDKTNKMIDFILKNPDSLALVMAYLVKYMDVYDINAKEIDKMLEALGLNALNEMIKLMDFNIFGYHINVNLNLAMILDYIKKQLTDNDDEKFLRYIVFPVIRKMLAGKYDFDIAAFWERIDSKVRDIDTSGGCDDAVAREGTTRDFSWKVYEALTNAIYGIESSGSVSVSSWGNYAGEEWYSPLLIGVAMKAINGYFSKITETNQICKAGMDTVFDNVQTIDDTISARLVLRCQELQSANTYITSMTNQMASR